MQTSVRFSGVSAGVQWSRFGEDKQPSFVSLVPFVFVVDYDWESMEVCPLPPLYLSPGSTPLNPSVSVELARGALDGLRK